MKRPFARHQEQTPSLPPSPCGSLWHCSVETLGSFQALWEHRSGLLDWPLLTRVQSPGLWGFPFSLLWLPWRSLYGDCLACAHHCVRQSRTREAQAQPREPTQLSLLTSGPYSVSLLSTVQALLHICSITVTFSKEMWKERCLFIPNGVQWAKESFLLSLFGKPVRLLGLNDKAWRRCHSQEGNSWAAPSLTNPSYHGSWLLTVASLEPSSSACRQLLCRVSSSHRLLAQPHCRVSWVL